MTKKRKLAEMNAKYMADLLDREGRTHKTVEEITEIMMKMKTVELENAAKRRGLI